jgi:hypothetical protein
MEQGGIETQRQNVFAGQIMLPASNGTGHLVPWLLVERRLVAKVSATELSAVSSPQPFMPLVLLSSLFVLPLPSPNCKETQTSIDECGCFLLKSYSAGSEPFRAATIA